MQKVVAITAMKVRRPIALSISVTTSDAIMLPQEAVTIVVSISVQKAVVIMKSLILLLIARRTVALTQVVTT